MEKTVTIKLVKSPITHPKNAAIRGMIRTVSHLVTVVEA